MSSQTTTMPTGSYGGTRELIHRHVVWSVWCTKAPRALITSRAKMISFIVVAVRLIFKTLLCTAIVLIPWTTAN